LCFQLTGIPFCIRDNFAKHFTHHGLVERRWKIEY
jgi:hypothetical protein